MALPILSVATSFAVEEIKLMLGKRNGNKRTRAKCATASIDN